MAEKYSKKTFIIKSELQLSTAMAYMVQNYQAALTDDTPLHIHITTKQDSRSVLQNRLYWKWLHEIQHSTGNSADDMHFEFKKKFLIAIYERDDQQYAEMCHAIKALKQSHSEQYKLVADGVIRETSTTKMTVKQFSEYLNHIHNFALVRLGIMLTTPDEFNGVY